MVDAWWMFSPGEDETLYDTVCAYAAIVVIPKAAMQMRGEPRYHKIVGGAGKAIERGFCPTCGSHVTDKLERVPHILALQAGSLDDPSMYRPMMDVFISS